MRVREAFIRDVLIQASAAVVRLSYRWGRVWSFVDNALEALEKGLNEALERRFPNPAQDAADEQLILDLRAVLKADRDELWARLGQSTCPICGARPVEVEAIEGPGGEMIPGRLHCPNALDRDHIGRVFDRLRDG